MASDNLSIPFRRDKSQKCARNPHELHFTWSIDLPTTFRGSATVGEKTLDLPEIHRGLISADENLHSATASDERHGSSYVRSSTDLSGGVVNGPK